MYQYTLLKQEGGTENLGISKKKKTFEELYKILNCTTIEIIPTTYYKGLGYGRCTMYGDEEGRFNQNNVRNSHFNVLIDDTGLEWDVVGDIVKEVSISKDRIDKARQEFEELRHDDELFAEQYDEEDFMEWFEDQVL